MYLLCPNPNRTFPVYFFTCAFVILGVGAPTATSIRWHNMYVFIHSKQIAICYTIKTTPPIKTKLLLFVFIKACWHILIYVSLLLARRQYHNPLKKPHSSIKTMTYVCLNMFGNHVVNFCSSQLRF